MTTNEHRTIAERYAFWHAWYATLPLDQSLRLAYYAASDWQRHAVRAAAAVARR
jgi:hypothetical protein